MIAMIGWLGLTIVVFLGTVAVPLSGMLFARKITVGPAFYNYALMPVGDRVAFYHRGCSGLALGRGRQAWPAESIVYCPTYRGSDRPCRRGSWGAPPFGFGGNRLGDICAGGFSGGIVS